MELKERFLDCIMFHKSMEKLLNNYQMTIKQHEAMVEDFKDQNISKEIVDGMNTELSNLKKIIAFANTKEYLETVIDKYWECVNEQFTEEEISLYCDLSTKLKDLDAVSKLGKAEIKMSEFIGDYLKSVVTKDNETLH